jgi:hypothetical protein
MPGSKPGVTPQVMEAVRESLVIRCENTQEGTGKMPLYAVSYCHMYHAHHTMVAAVRPAGHQEKEDRHAHR